MPNKLNWIHQIKFLCFDVDGTLADTEDAHRIAFNRAFAENNLDWNWDVALYGKLLEVTGGKERIRYFVETCLPNFVKPGDYEGFIRNLHAVKTDYYIAMLRDGLITLRPGIKQLITDARNGGIRLAIATTTSPENVATLLQQGLGADGANWFEAIGCGDIVPHKKPAPDIYFWVLEKLGLPATDCIALEDSENGLRSSLEAGIKTFVILNRYTRGQDFSGAAAVFDGLADLGNFYRLTGLPLPKRQISV